MHVLCQANRVYPSHRQNSGCQESSLGANLFWNQLIRQLHSKAHISPPGLRNPEQIKKASDILGWGDQYFILFQVKTTQLCNTRKCACVGLYVELYNSGLLALSSWWGDRSPTGWWTPVFLQQTFHSIMVFRWYGEDHFQQLPHIDLSPTILLKLSSIPLFHKPPGVSFQWFGLRGPGENPQNCLGNVEHRLHKNLSNRAVRLVMALRAPTLPTPEA